MQEIKGKREPADGGGPPGGPGTRPLLAESRRVNRRFQYQTMAWTIIVLAVLVFLSYRVYADARMDIEEQFNRQQLFLADQASGRIASFLDELTASIRYSAVFLRTVGPNHPGRMSAMAGLYERLGGRLRVSEVGFIRKGAGPDPTASREDVEAVSRCTPEKGACLFIIREPGGMPAYLLGTAFVVGGDWLFAKVTLDDIARAFITPVQSGLRGRAWLAGGGRILVAPGIRALEGTRLADLAREAGDGRLKRIVGRMLEGERGFDWHLDFRPGRAGGKDRALTAFSPLVVGDERWVLAVTAPSSEVVDLVRRTFRKGFLITAFGFIVVISAALLVLDRERRRIRAEDRLIWSARVLESKQRLQALFDGITDGIGILDRDFRIRLVNLAMARLFGCGVADLLNQPWDAERPSRVPRPLADRGLARETFEKGVRGFAERTAVMPDGKRLDLEIYTYPIFGESGEAVQAIIYLKDVTERRALQRQVQQRDRLSIVGKMSAQVAHEIRNPLSAINLNAELLEDELLRVKEVDTSEAWEMLRSIKAEVDILRQVTDDYLKFVRMPRSDRRPADLGDVLDDLLSFYSEEALSRNIRIERDFARGLPEVELDETQIRVALQNLIRNGFDAMPGGGVLTVRTRLRQDRVEVEIADNGTGIRAEDQASLFTPFFTTKAHGTGLGLALTQQIVTEHRGTIRFASREGEGTVFTIELPAAEKFEASV